MALNNVNPGDLIKAADWNALVAAINGLSGQPTTGPISIPNLFGLTLANAVAVLALPSTQLTRGQVLDTLGNTVDPNASGSGSLIVLNQSPVAGSSAFAGAAVNLVVSPAAGSSPPPPKTPSISGFKPSTPVPIGAQLEIDGLNFDPLPQNNQVSFAGITAAAPSGSSNPVQLFVIVPTGIPGAPTTSGQTLSVNVLVTTPSGSVSSSVTITAPLANPLPTIQSFGGQQTVGGSLTISGTGFSPTPASNTVMFDTVAATPTSASQTQLTVTIPTGIAGLSTVPSFRNVPVTVTVAGQTSPAVLCSISNLS